MLIESDTKIAELFSHESESKNIKEVQSIILQARKLLFDMYLRKGWKPWDFGNYAYENANKGDVTEAIFWWKVAATMGDSASKTNLEICEREGLLPKTMPEPELVYYRVKP